MKISKKFIMSYDTPWKLINEVKRVCIQPLVRFWLLTMGIGWGEGWKIYGFPIIQKCTGSSIQIGSHLELRSFLSSNPLVPYHPVLLSTRNKLSRIIIGNYFSMTGGSLIAEDSIDIGNNVTIGANSIIIDSDFHPIDGTERLKSFTHGKNRPVSIDDNVFIGTNVIILKGVHIGKNSVIGAGSVVTSDVDANSLFAGNPARFIKKLV